MRERRQTKHGEDNRITTIINSSVTWLTTTSTLSVMLMHFSRKTYQLSNLLFVCWFGSLSVRNKLLKCAEKLLAFLTIFVSCTRWHLWRWSSQLCLTQTICSTVSSCRSRPVLKCWIDRLKNFWITLYLLFLSLLFVIYCQGVFPRVNALLNVVVLCSIVNWLFWFVCFFMHFSSIWQNSPLVG